MIHDHMLLDQILACRILLILCACIWTLTDLTFHFSDRDSPAGRCLQPLLTLQLSQPPSNSSLRYSVDARFLLMNNEHVALEVVAHAAREYTSARFDIPDIGMHEHPYRQLSQNGMVAG
ncbi:hypothetical protein VPH35_124247 [Triticum aestivum]